DAVRALQRLLKRRAVADLRYRDARVRAEHVLRLVGVAHDAKRILAQRAQFLDGCAARVSRGSDDCDHVPLPKLRAGLSVSHPGTPPQGHASSRPHTSFATCTQCISFWNCPSGEITLPSEVDEKPHCGLIASCSSGTTFDASSIRRFSMSFGSRSAVFEVTSP